MSLANIATRRRLRRLRSASPFRDSSAPAQNPSKLIGYSDFPLLTGRASQRRAYVAIALIELPDYGNASGELPRRTATASCRTARTWRRRFRITRRRRTRERECPSKYTGIVPLPCEFRQHIHSKTTATVEVCQTVSLFVRACTHPSKVSATRLFRCWPAVPAAVARTS